MTKILNLSLHIGEKEMKKPSFFKKLGFFISPFSAFRTQHVYGVKCFNQGLGKVCISSWRSSQSGR